MGDDAVLRFDDRGEAARCVQAERELSGLVESAGTSKRSDLSPKERGTLANPPDSEGMEPPQRCFVIAPRQESADTTFGHLGCAVKFAEQKEQFDRLFEVIRFDQIFGVGDLKKSKATRLELELLTEEAAEEGVINDRSVGGGRGRQMPKPHIAPNRATIGPAESLRCTQGHGVEN